MIDDHPDPWDAGTREPGQWYCPACTVCYTAIPPHPAEHRPPHDNCRYPEREDQPVWLDGKTVAMLLQVQPRTVRQWARRGHTVFRDGLYDYRAVLDWWHNYRDEAMVKLSRRTS